MTTKRDERADQGGVAAEALAKIIAIEKSLHLTEVGDFAGAAALLASTPISDSDPDILALRAKISAKKGDRREARRLWTLSIELSPDATTKRRHQADFDDCYATNSRALAVRLLPIGLVLALGAVTTVAVYENVRVKAFSIQVAEMVRIHKEYAAAQIALQTKLSQELRASNTDLAVEILQERALSGKIKDVSDVLAVTRSELRSATVERRLLEWHVQHLRRLIAKLRQQTLATRPTKPAENINN